MLPPKIRSRVCVAFYCEKIKKEAGFSEKEAYLFFALLEGVREMLMEANRDYYDYYGRKAGRRLGEAFPVEVLCIGADWARALLQFVTIVVERKAKEEEKK